MTTPAFTGIGQVPRPVAIRFDADGGGQDGEGLEALYREEWFVLGKAAKTFTINADDGFQPFDIALGTGIIPNRLYVKTPRDKNAVIKFTYNDGINPEYTKTMNLTDLSYIGLDPAESQYITDAEVGTDSEDSIKIRIEVYAISFTPPTTFS